MLFHKALCPKDGFLNTKAYKIAFLQPRMEG